MVSLQIVATRILTDHMREGAMLIREKTAAAFDGYLFSWQITFEKPQRHYVRCQQEALQKDKQCLAYLQEGLML